MTIREVWTEEAAKLVGKLARAVGGDVGLADDIAQDVYVAACEAWKPDDLPRDPGAWLVTAAKKRAAVPLDRAQLAEDAADDALRVVFATCHPTLALEARVMLTLRLVGGLTTAELAHAFDSTQSAIEQRVLQAKQQLAAAEAPFVVPRGPASDDRLASVLEVIYLVFNQGYGADGALCEDAMRIALLVARLMPGEPEVHGLLALMAFHLSRSAALRGPDGEPVMLLEQDRALWDSGLVARGMTALERAEAAGDRGPYTCQAAIAACHARAPTPDETEWPRIAMLYGKLAAIVGSPAVELNRAVAVAMAYGPAQGLEIVDALAREPGLVGYHLVPSARADLLAKLGRYDEARAEFERAAKLTPDARERTHLLASAAACVPSA